MSGPDSRPANILRKAYVTGLFTGYAPVAPGTAGSALGLCIALIPGFTDPAVLILMITVAFILGVRLSSAFSTVENPDPSVIVIDEIVGMWLALFLLPGNALAFGLAFLAFRLFDIVKPFPARQAEKLSAGWGIMTDDLIAGVYANLLVRFLLFIPEIV